MKGRAWKVRGHLQTSCHVGKAASGCRIWVRAGAGLARRVVELKEGGKKGHGKSETRGQMMAGVDENERRWCGGWWERGEERGQVEDLKQEGGQGGN